MQKHLVKCKVCGQMLDLNREQGVKCSARRYAHYECCPDGEIVPIPPDPRTQEEKDLDELKAYAKQLLGDTYIARKVNKQIKDFHEQEGYTYSGIKRTLIWFYEIQKNPIDKANGGIGIVPYVFADAKNYYYQLFLAKQSLELTDNFIPMESKEITIQSPRTKIKKHKLFRLWEGEK